MPKTIAIMQPTYLPWMGYFAMIEKVDQFVFLDTVQFDHRSWQQRNRIKTPHGALWLTLSVMQKGMLDQKIKDVICLDLKKDLKKHLASIEHAYKKTKSYQVFYPELCKRLQGLFDESINHLSDLNISLIKFMCTFMGIKTPFICSSELDVSGQKGDLLANICSRLGANYYLSPLGAKIYLDHCDAFEEKGINILYHHYEHPVYPQCFGEFIEGMSCVDAIFNVDQHSVKPLIMSGVL